MAQPSGAQDDPPYALWTLPPSDPLCAVLICSSGRLPAAPKRAAPTSTSSRVLTTVTTPPGTLNAAQQPSAGNLRSSGKAFAANDRQSNSSPQPRPSIGHRRNNSSIGVQPSDLIPSRSKDGDALDTPHLDPPAMDPSPRTSRLGDKEKVPSFLEHSTETHARRSHVPRLLPAQSWTGLPSNQSAFTDDQSMP